MSMCRDTPSLALPPNGRVSHRVYGTTSHQPAAGTFPLAGEVGRGDDKWL
jgi:hypothetical protein